MSTATKKKTEFEINRYLVEKLKRTFLRNIRLFELQTLVNNLSETYSDSIVRHAFANLKSILKVAKKLKEDLEMPLTRPVDKPTITAEQINSLIEAIEDLHDLCLMAVGLFCATRTSESFRAAMESYQQDKLIIQTTAFEGRL